MRILCVLLLLFPLQRSFAQSADHPIENIFIITTDGFRWQEVFSGADSSLLYNPAYVKDTGLLASLYWAASAEERRKKLMPFLWNYVAQKGQLWGNRTYENNVGVSNPYRFSYAGYSELLTGFADPAIVRNRPKSNPNSNLFEYLNQLPAYKDKIAVFGSWKLFSYILNEGRSGVPVNCGYEDATADSLSIPEQAVNMLQQNSSEKDQPTRLDMLTYTLAAEYIQKKHPRVVYLGFGETDEFAHHSRYDKYLGQANLFDKFLGELWQLVQEDEFYRNKTAFFITTDHGRGERADKWPVHGPFVKGSAETWFGQMGPGISALGEIKSRSDIYTEQFAQTIASYLGEYFIAAHPVAAPVYTLQTAKISR